MRKQLIRFSALSAALAMLFAGPFAAAYPSGNYGSGTYGACNYGTVCSITLTSDGAISLNITPSTSRRCTVQSDTASVLTDDSNGYTLTLADNGTNTALVNGGNTIAASGATLASPAAISGNTWGYRDDGLGSFGGGPTTVQSNVSPDSTLFAGIKASNLSADTIAATSAAADPAVTTTVWYGACADSGIASGAYTTQVTYTAVAN